MTKSYKALFIIFIGLFILLSTSFAQETADTSLQAVQTMQEMPASEKISAAQGMIKYSNKNENGLPGIESILRGLLGILALVLLSWAVSVNRKAVNWGLVLKGLVLQLLIAILVLKVPAIQLVFEYISKVFVKILSFSGEGSKFLFRSFGTGEIESPLINFAVIILPVIIFFSALTSLFFYLGILQRIVFVFAWLMKKTLKLSGAESLAAAGNIFLGQTESPLLIKPYIPFMTKSELMCLMTGGMATIAGSVFAAYIGYLGGSDPAEQLYFAKHLLTASVMSAPAAVVAAKIIVPETERISTAMEISKEKIGKNVLEAITNGTSEGLRLAVNVAAMLLVFIAIVAMGNFILLKIGVWTGLNAQILQITGGRYAELSMEFLLGYLGAPFCWIMGVPTEDIYVVGQLLGQKTVLNEFYAYSKLGEYLRLGTVFTHQKSIIMATYMLCGFANFASIGIQIGGIGALAPERKGVLSQLGFKALIGGTVASLFTAVMVGILY
jgi:CNT family concentrative nucleoside transporter